MNFSDHIQTYFHKVQRNKEMHKAYSLERVRSCYSFCNSSESELPLRIKVAIKNVFGELK